MFLCLCVRVFGRAVLLCHGQKTVGGRGLANQWDKQRGANPQFSV